MGTRQMPTTQPPADLPRKIQQLLEDRQRHADALSLIDHVLASVGAALGGNPVAVAARGPKGNSSTRSSPAPGQDGAASGRKRRKAQKFSTTGDESVLAFVKERKNPTSQEIEGHWKGEGRGGPAANTLTKLVKAKKLKRTPLGKGVRGSRYSLA